MPPANIALHVSPAQSGSGERRLSGRGSGDHFGLLLSNFPGIHLNTVRAPEVDILRLDTSQQS
jgi:hypothetical protein